MLQAPATTSGVNINSVQTALTEKMHVLTEEREASKAKNQKLLAKLQEASRAEN